MSDHVQQQVSDALYKLGQVFTNYDVKDARDWYRSFLHRDFGVLHLEELLRQRENFRSKWHREREARITAEAEREALRDRLAEAPTTQEDGHER